MNKTKQQLASERISRDLKAFEQSGGKIKKLAHDEFGINWVKGERKK